MIRRAITALALALGLAIGGSGVGHVADHAPTDNICPTDVDDDPLSGYSALVPVTSAQFRMADRIVEGRLAEIILALEADDVPAEEIARRLFSDHSIVVSGQTIRRWLVQLKPAEAAS